MTAVLRFGKVMEKTTSLLTFLTSTFPKTRGYWKLKGETLDSHLGRSWFGRGYESFARQAEE